MYEPKNPENVEDAEILNDPEVKADLEKLSKSRLTLESFNEYMRLRAEQERLGNLPENVRRHNAKVLAKRRKANKVAKKARKLNRKK